MINGLGIVWVFTSVVHVWRQVSAKCEPNWLHFSKT